MRASTPPPLLFALFAVLATAACGGDDAGTDTDATTDSATSSGSDTADTADTGTDTDAEAEPELAVVVIGDLAGDDLAASQVAHDMVAMGGEDQAKMAGDFGHDAMLGTTLLGTTENEFLAIDRWSSDDNIDAFYGDPNFQMAFGALFEAPPAPSMYIYQDTWAHWGELTSGDAATPHFFVVVRGRLASADSDANKALHDMIAEGGKEMVMAAGDVAHVPFTGRADPQEFLNIDIWTSADNIEAVYTNPDFIAAFGQLFEAPPQVGVYQSTDWHQW
ncbi:MAG: hypothetical protein R3A51_09000 [Nannocystaceae bacterium]